MARIYLSPPHLSGRESELVAEAIASNWIAPLGPQVDAFEAELAAVAGVEHAVALSSGTAALHLALVVLGIGAGDEVACPSFTFAASANAITYTGATPFFVDADEATWTIDLDLLDRAIVERREAGADVRAVVAVDLYGQCCDYDALRELCEQRGVALVQDAAESLGSTYRGAAAGGQGALAAFSFNGNKIITTSGGGMLVSAERRLGRARPEALDAGARARRPLRARRDGLQLPAVERARGARARPARDAARARRDPAPPPRPVPRAARRARDRVHARGWHTGRRMRG